jgi:twitching motility protein PilT
MDPIPAEVAEQSLLAIVTDGQHKEFKDTNDLDFSYDGGPELGRFRANFYRHLRGVDGVFRLIPETIRTFDELGLPEVIKKLISYKVGIVLVTGPKSSGKTTTTAALVDLINRTRPDHVVMMEDPIEFVQPCRLGHINQREVGPHTRSFANAMRAVLREAPDVIMVGEMRDLETTSLAITAAETGHLVISTLHTADAVRTIGRLLDVFPPREQPQIRAMVSESLRGVISQQLIPRADNTGMALALEIMINTTAIANLIRDDRAYQMPGVIQTGKKWGMQLMDESLIELAREGVIATHEAVARAVEVGRVKKELRVT